MENAAAEVNVHVGDLSSRGKNIEKYFSNFTITPTKIKLLSAFAFGGFFGAGLRSVYRHTKGQALSNIRSGFALGLRAFGIATVLSVSGVGLLIVTVSAVLNVNSAQQFGQKMTNLCGDRFRINRGGESIATFAEIFETKKGNESSEET